jgi:predicted RNA binding protein YcfA (HicA-like mRNA interferase family)
MTLAFTPFKLYGILMNGKALVKYLQGLGWAVDRIHGSHFIMVKVGRRPIPVPVHGSHDLPVGLVQSILREAKEG